MAWLKRRFVVPPTPVWLPSRRWHRQAYALFDQQLWCWGQDIDRPAGNALLQYGFQRQALPAAQAGASLYWYRFPDGSQLLLRGFGVFFHQAGQGAIFIDRPQFRPRLLVDPDLPRNIWTMDNLPRLMMPRAGSDKAAACELLAQSCRWMAEYESWVLSHLGRRYRAACIRRWPRAVVAGGHTADAWSELASALCSGVYKPY